MEPIECANPSPLQNFEVKADDLELIEELGRGAYGVVEKMRHVPSGVIMAVKVGWECEERGWAPGPRRGLRPAPNP